MSTLVPFTPSSSANFSFQPTFDGQLYNVVITWNFYGQRYYVNCYTIQGVLVYCLPLIGSPDDYAINLNGGYFDTPMSFLVSSQSFVIG